ncbi:MAG: putative ABC exporter domain-containing protein, partial [Gemmatimonadales bacterium]
NGAAILYPAWVHLGSGRPGGIEALGQNMLMLVAFGALLATVLLPAAAIGGGVFLLLRPSIAGWAVGPGMVLGLAVLAFECGLIVNWLGGVFERTDPAEIH